MVCKRVKGSVEFVSTALSKLSSPADFGLDHTNWTSERVVMIYYASQSFGFGTTGVVKARTSFAGANEVLNESKLYWKTG